MSFLDSDPRTADDSQEAAMGLTLDNTMNPTILRQLALSMEDLQWREEATVHSDPSVYGAGARWE